MSTLGIILIILLLLFLFGGLPAWGIHSYGWGPSGIVFILIIVLLVLALTGRI